MLISYGVRCLLFCRLYVQKAPLFPPCSFFHPSLTCLIDRVCVCACCCMPPLKETRLQIQERTAREIRNRTVARLAQLRTESVEKARQTEQESDEEDGVDDRSVDKKSLLCCRLCCFLLFLYLCLCLNHLSLSRTPYNLS
jgi:hypothetical protein